MKKFLIRILLFGVLIIAILLVLYTLPPINKLSYYYEINHKISLVDTVKRPRIIFIGGSNVAFGVNSKEIGDSLGLYGINTGLHAGLGLKYQIESVEKHLHKGDILVIMPEYDQFYGICNGIPIDIASIQKTRRFKELSILSIPQLIEVIKGVPQASLGGIKQSIDTMYNANNFNSHGDEIHHLNIKNFKQSNHTINSSIDNSSIRYFRDKLILLRQHYKVILLPPLTLQYYYNRDKEKITTLNEILKSYNVVFDEEIESHVMPDSCAFDTHYHLNGMGVEIATQIIISELKETITNKSFGI